MRTISGGGSRLPGQWRRTWCPCLHGERVCLFGWRVGLCAGNESSFLIMLFNYGCWPWWMEGPWDRHQVGMLLVPSCPCVAGLCPQGTLTWGAWGRCPHRQLVLGQWHQQQVWCYQVRSGDESLLLVRLCGFLWSMGRSILISLWEKKSLGFTGNNRFLEIFFFFWSGYYGFHWDTWKM